MNSFLLSLWLAAAPDPWRCITPNIARIVQADCNQVALKEPAQIIAAAIEPKLDTTPIDRGFHLGRTGEREGHISTADGLLGGHLAELLSLFADMGDRPERNVINVPIGVLDHQHRNPDKHLPGTVYRQGETIKSGYDERIKSFVAHPLF
jgi:hypothetical protein